jgi:hypothetical protein
MAGLDFGGAVSALKMGRRVYREGWNGKGMWLGLVKEITLTSVENGKPLPWIGMKTADDHFVPWTASQTDMLAEDWRIVAE